MAASGTQVLWPASAAASTAARSPLMTIWPGELRLATRQDARAVAGRHEVADALVGQADDGRHGAVARGGLHEPAALADEAQRVGEVQDAGRDHGAVLAHRVAGEEGRPARGRRGAAPATSGAERAMGRDGRGQERRLRVDGQVERLGRPFPGQPREGLAERLVRVAPDRCRLGRGDRQRVGPCRPTASPGRGRCRQAPSPISSRGGMGRRWRSVRDEAATRRDGCTVAGPARRSAGSCAIMHTMDDAAALAGRPGRSRRAPEPAHPVRSHRRRPGPLARARHRLRAAARVARPRLHAARGALRGGRDR